MEQADQAEMGYGLIKTATTESSEKKLLYFILERNRSGMLPSFLLQKQMYIFTQK